MIIIPDIHGRSFWKNAVKGRETEDIVFLGDYLDPYSYEGISRGITLANFKEILDFKHSHTNNVTLLLGNHDLGYICPDINLHRHDLQRHNEIKQILTDNLDCFQLCTSRDIKDTTYLFSHSFVNKYWIEACKWYLKFEYKHPSELSEILNKMLYKQPKKMFELLSIISHHRGGDYEFGSMVWSDLMEVNLPEPFLENVVNVFGHTQVKKPAIYKKFVCLDTKQAFDLQNDGKFVMIN